MIITNDINIFNYKNYRKIKNLKKKTNCYCEIFKVL